MDCKILVTEDNFIASDDLCDRLKELGYQQIETAYDGEEAVQKAKDFNPDLIIMDINLGDGINGIEVAEIITKNQDVSIIYLTAYDEDATFLEAKKTAPYAYLIKPYNLRELKIALEISLYKFKTEKKLKKLNETKDKLFSIIAHDLKNPFHSIIGFSELLLDSVKKDKYDKVEQYSRIIYNSAYHGSFLLDNLLEWTRSERGSISFKPEKIVLHELFNDVSELLKIQALEKGIEIVVNCSEKIILTADSNMLQTVIRNLISNALKFSFSGSKVVVNAKETDSMVKISVEDSGRGIKGGDKGKLMKLSSGFSTQGTNSEKGTGLGLVLCKEFVEKHNGNIWFESIEGEGTTFFVELPNN